MEWFHWLWCSERYLWISFSHQEDEIMWSGVLTWLLSLFWWQLNLKRSFLLKHVKKNMNYPYDWPRRGLHLRLKLNLVCWRTGLWFLHREISLERCSVSYQSSGIIRRKSCSSTEESLAAWTSRAIDILALFYCSFLSLFFHFIVIFMAMSHGSWSLFVATTVDTSNLHYIP